MVLEISTPIDSLSDGLHRTEQGCGEPEVGAGSIAAEGLVVVREVVGTAEPAGSAGGFVIPLACERKQPRPRQLLHPMRLLQMPFVRPQPSQHHHLSRCPASTGLLLQQSMEHQSGTVPRVERRHQPLGPGRAQSVPAEGLAELDVERTG